MERLKKEAAGREEAGLSLASTLKSLTEANQAWEADSRHVRSSRLYDVFCTSFTVQYFLYTKFPWRLNLHTKRGRGGRDVRTGTRPVQTELIV